jgi:hypothetical protein
MSTAQPISGILAAALEHAQQSPTSVEPTRPSQTEPSEKPSDERLSSPSQADIADHFLWLKRSDLAPNQRRAITALGMALDLEEEKARLIFKYCPQGSGKMLFEALALVYALETAGTGDGAKNPVGMAISSLKGVNFHLNNDAVIVLEDLKERYEQFLDGEAVDIPHYEAALEENLKRRSRYEADLDKRAEKRSKIQAQYTVSRADLVEKPIKPKKKNAEVEVRVKRAETTPVTGEATAITPSEATTTPVTGEATTTPVTGEATTTPVTGEATTTPVTGETTAITAAKVEPLEDRVILYVGDLVEVCEDGKKLQGNVLSMNKGYIEVELLALNRSVSFPAPEIAFVARPEAKPLPSINSMIEAGKAKLKPEVKFQRPNTITMSEIMEEKDMVFAVGMKIRSRRGPLTVISLEPLQMKTTSGHIYSVILE